ncbi:LD-carboxypeptidase [bacterium]|nr:LD-carboxypeptidase [bacterium]
MRQPPYLNPGDKIAITTTARSIAPSEIAAGLAAIQFHGFEPVVSKTIGSSHHIFGGNDELRASELQTLLDREDIQAIWLARGGYGTIRILNRLNWQRFIEKPKWLIGFSDASNLLATANQHKIACIHGPMPKTLATDFEDDPSCQLLFSLLGGNEASYHWQAGALDIAGNATGEITGGNLATIAHLYPSLSHDFFDHKILFIEEIDEYLYQADRMLRGMLASGRLRHLKAVVAGHFTGMKDNETAFGENIHEIITQLFAPLGIPVATGFMGGHEQPNWPIVFGKKHQLSYRQNHWQLTSSHT